MGHLVALLLLKKVFPHYQGAVCWINDSTTAIDWVEKEKCNSSSGLVLNLIAAWFQIHAKLHITRTNRIAGANMGFIDDLSRDHENSLRKSVKSVVIEDIPPVLTLFRLCYPSSDLPFNDNLNLFFHIHRLIVLIL
jgi:hypothetical protein